MKNDNENKIDQDEEGSQGGESGDTGQGGVTGAVHFRYQDSLSTRRDDALPPTEIRRLLAIHQDLHKEFVNKQKLTRKERKALKEGRKTLDGRRGYGHGAGRVSIYKQHPITSKAQFSGMDPQVIGLPNENLQNTNDDKRNELENRLEHRLENRNELRATPKFNPVPRPR
jgi:hypothetical protein